MGKVNVVIVDATGNKEQKVGLPDDIKCGIIMVKLVEKIKLPSVGPDGNPISYKFIHKVTGRQLLEAQTLAEAGIRDGDVLRLQPEITAGAFCEICGAEIKEGVPYCVSCGNIIGKSGVDTTKFTQVKPPETNFSFAEQSVQSLSGKISKRKAFFPICGIISGIISVIFGIIMFFGYTGGYELSKSYGGDAYTGIQNASAQAANNIQALGEIAKRGLAFLLIALGLIAICYFAMNLGQNGKNK